MTGRRAGTREGDAPRAAARRAARAIAVRPGSAPGASATTPRPVRAQATSETERLCLSCGLCCNGSLFWAVPVARGESVPAPLDAEGRLRQPCACFDGACTIYAARPAACRSFDCRVLQTVRAGRRDHAWAREQIAGMRRVLAALEAALPGSEPSLYRRAAEFLARHEKDLSDPAFQRKHRRVLRCLAAYEAALARFHVAAGQKKQ